MIPAGPLTGHLTPLEAIVATAAARCVRGAPAAVSPDTPFALLNLDSLATLELAAALEEALGCPLPDELVYECADVRTLACRLEETLAARDTRSPAERMRADAVLPDDVVPPRGAVASCDLRSAGSVLLTGATGFVGAAIARELLDTSPVRLVCLVRPCPDPRSARRRLDTQLRAAGVAPALLRRVRVLTGDLARPSLGRTTRRLLALADGLGAICHAGAAVNWVHPYAGLRGANVEGTRELLRIACTRGIPFHFVSSASVCYSTSAGRAVDERFDPMSHLTSVHLGYAQSKAVAEALVREAGERGLPVRIYRPSLISGHSRTGAYNPDDLMTALMRGCIHMGTAPDLDWRLDSLPVDGAAAAIVALSGQKGPVFHLAHPRPRHWRECVLWMRLYGYRVRLVSYHAWLRQLEAGTGASGDAEDGHPLRRLRSFFLYRPSGERGLTLPELYEAGRRPVFVQEESAARLAACGWTCPPLGADLLETYCSAMRRQGHLPAPPGPTGTGGLTVHRPDLGCPAPPQRASEPTTAFFSQLLRRPVTRVTRLDAGFEHSIVSELAAWRSRQPTGLSRFELQLDGGSTRRVVLKVKARDEDVLDAGEALAHVCDPALGALFADWRHRLGIAGAQERELALYRQSDPRFVRHTPAVLGARTEADGERLLVLEQIADATLMDADGVEGWTPRRLGLAIDGLAALHAIWFGRGAELHEQPWIGHVQSARGMAEMRELWTALAKHAEPSFSAWAGAGMVSIQRHLIEEVERWWADLDSPVWTLIHNDFNPRNIAIRGRGGAERLCAYDWELASAGAPQRDLAELLIFVLPPNVSRDALLPWIVRHRHALERETGAAIAPAQWMAGFRAALNDLLINRLAMYALIHRVRRQRFLPRVVATWRRLHELVPDGRPAGGAGS